MKFVVAICLVFAILADASAKKRKWKKKYEYLEEKYNQLEEKFGKLYEIVHALQQQVEECCDKTDCEYNGVTYSNGDSFPKGDGCNNCTCQEGSVGCTKINCDQDCEYNGVTYSNGATFPKGDGCNNCTCKKGSVGCTKINCDQDQGGNGPSCFNSTCRDCKNKGEVLELDLRGGTTSGSLTGVDVLTAPYLSPINSTIPCSWRALLKAKFEPASADPCRNLLKVQMNFGQTRAGWMLFNFGDSKTNNGYGGDGSTQSRDSEIDAFGSSGAVRSMKSDHCEPKGGEFDVHPGALAYGTDKATMWLGHNYYRLKTNNMDEERCSNCLFDLNDGVDYEGPVNRELYLAFNRVVSGTMSRNGAGTCKVKLSWECNIPSAD